MSTIFTSFVDTGYLSTVGRLQPMSETATWLANLSRASSDHHYNFSLSSFQESVPTYVSLLYPSQGVIVFCLASVFFSLGLALFAICTSLVDVGLRLEDAYIWYILLLDRLCNRYLKTVDAAGEVLLVMPSRIASMLADAVVTFSKATLHFPPWMLRILSNWRPHRLAEFIVDLVHTARLSIKARTLPICAFSCALVEQLFHAVLRAAHRLPVNSTRTCLLLAAKWIYARGRTLHTAVCVGATHAIAIAIRLPSRRTYSRAWGGVMRPRAGSLMSHQPAAGQLHHAEAVLSWCVHHGDSSSICQTVGAPAEVSFNITLDLDIGEDGDLHVAVVLDTSMQRPTIMPRILCDAATQTEDQRAAAEEQIPTKDPEDDTILGLLVAGPESRRGLENTNSLALTTGVHASSNMGSDVPVSPTGAFTFRFNPHPSTFAPVRPASPPDGHVAMTIGDSPSGTQLNPLAEEFNIPALSHDGFPADALGLDMANIDCSKGESEDPPSSETDVPKDILSPLPLAALTFAPAVWDSGVAMAPMAGDQTEEVEVEVSG